MQMGLSEQNILPFSSSMCASSAEEKALKIAKGILTGDWPAASCNISRGYISFGHQPWQWESLKLNGFFLGK